MLLRAGPGPGPSLWTLLAEPAATLGTAAMQVLDLLERLLNEPAATLGMAVMQVLDLLEWVLVLAHLPLSLQSQQAAPAAPSCHGP